jgi:hypothetical protein
MASDKIRGRKRVASDGLHTELVKSLGPNQPRVWLVQTQCEAVGWRASHTHWSFAHASIRGNFGVRN